MGRRFIECLDVVVGQILVSLSQQHTGFVEEHENQLSRTLRFGFCFYVNIAV
jgi:hypothetical protein